MRLTSGAYLVICSSCDEGLPAMFQVFPVLLTSRQTRLLARHSNGKHSKCINPLFDPVDCIAKRGIKKLLACLLQVMAGDGIAQQPDADTALQVEQGLEQCIAMQHRFVGCAYFDDE